MTYHINLIHSLDRHSGLGVKVSCVKDPRFDTRPRHTRDLKFGNSGCPVQRLALWDDCWDRLIQC